jgi:hypothetical protein
MRPPDETGVTDQEYFPSNRSRATALVATILETFSGPEN